MFAFTLNRVQMRKDGESVIVPAHTVKAMDDTTFSKLKKLGAVRAATEDEITIFKSGNPGTTDVTVADNDDTSAGSDTAADSTPPPSGAKGDPAPGQAAKGAKSSKSSNKTSEDDEDI